MKSPLGSTIESMMSLIVAVLRRSGWGWDFVHAVPNTNTPARRTQHNFIRSLLFHAAVATSHRHHRLRKIVKGLCSPLTEEFLKFLSGPRGN
jgi:hypothetical protein